MVIELLHVYNNHIADLPMPSRIASGGRARQSATANLALGTSYVGDAGDNGRPFVFVWSHERERQT